MTMDRITFLTKYKTSREKLSNAIQLIQEHSELEQKINDKWTIIEHLAHILWYEEQMVTMLQNRDMTANQEIWQKPLHERNHEVHRIQAKLTKDQILSLNKTIPLQLQDLLKALDDKMLNEADWITHMPSDWKPWDVIAGNTFEHYESHLSQFKSHCLYL